MEKALRAQLPAGAFLAVSPGRSRAMAAVRGKGNKTTERRLRLGMVRAGIRGWKLHYKGAAGHPDFFFPEQKIAVFVDGCFWHGCPKCGHVPHANNAFWNQKIKRNRTRDVETGAKLAAQNVVLLRFWEHDLREDLASCVILVKEIVRKRSRGKWESVLIEGKS